MGMLEQLYEVEVEEAKCVARRIGEREELCKLMDGSDHQPTNRPGAPSLAVAVGARAIGAAGFSVRKV